MNQEIKIVHYNSPFKFYHALPEIFQCFENIVDKQFCLPKKVYLDVYFEGFIEKEKQVFVL